MKFRGKVIRISNVGQEHRRAVGNGASRVGMETLGLNLCESKAMLENVQNFVAARQIAEDFEQRHHCPNCRDRYTAKGGGMIRVKTLFGPVGVTNPRWTRCSCQQSGPKIFPLAAWDDQSGVAVPGN
jgi:hypothetical protein